MMNDPTLPAPHAPDPLGDDPSPEAIDALDRAARRALLSSYLDDELPTEVGRAVTAWLEEHPDALRDVEHLRRLWDLLESYEDEPVPPRFAEQVLGATIAPARARSRWWAPTLAAAAALLVGIGAALFAMRGTSSDPEPDEASEMARALGDVPVDYLAEADVLLSLSDEAFEVYLLETGTPEQGSPEQGG